LQSSAGAIPAKIYELTDGNYIKFYAGAEGIMQNAPAGPERLEQEHKMKSRAG
jgi:hypothetical protein